jgi:hypothetical protein
MFELADRLVGIYKTHNCTKSATINPDSFLKNCALSSQPNKVTRKYIVNNILLLRLESSLVRGVTKAHNFFTVPFPN